MANTIKIRRGSGNPGVGVLQDYELGWDYTNKDLYIGVNTASPIILSGPWASEFSYSAGTLSVSSPTINVNVLVASGTIASSNFSGSSSGTNTGDQVSSEFDHNQLINYLPNEHIDWTNTTANLLTTGNATVNDLVVGNLTVNGVTTTINSVTVSVDDKNIEIGAVASPSDITANGGGITLKGSTDKTIIWSNTTSSWEFNQPVIVSGSISASNFSGSSSGTNTGDQDLTVYTNHIALVNEHLDWTVDLGATNINVNNVPEAGNAATLENQTVQNILSTASQNTIAMVIALGG